MTPVIITMVFKNCKTISNKKGEFLLAHILPIFTRSGAALSFLETSFGDLDGCPMGVPTQLTSRSVIFLQASFAN